MPNEQVLFIGWAGFADAPVSRHGRIIFLDIDGVLNNPGCYAHGSGNNVPPDPRCIAALNRLTDATGAAIVVSSTWRLMGHMFVREKLHEWGVKAPVLDVTPRLDHELKGATFQEARGCEIQAWLDKWPRDVESFVILDDDADMGPLMSHLIQTAGHVGLTDADADRAVQLLVATSPDSVGTDGRTTRC